MNLPRRLDRDRSIREAFVARGAVSAGGARPLSDFPSIPPERFAELLDRGVIREGAPGTYYLYVRQPSARATRQFVMSLLFWILVLLIPVAVIQFSAGR